MMVPPRLKIVALVLPAAVTLLIWHTVGAGRLLSLEVMAAYFLGAVMSLVWFGPQWTLILLLVAGYFSGWIKLRYGSWIGYAAPDALCVVLLAGVFLGRRRAGLPLPRSGLTAAILLLTLLCVLEFLNPEAPFIRSLAGFRSLILYTWLMFAGYEMLQSPRQLQQIYVCLIALSIVTGAYGVYQWRQGPSALMVAGASEKQVQYAQVMSWRGKDTSRVFRAFSTFVSPGAFGGNMAAGLLIVFVLIGTQGIPRWIKYFGAAGSPLMVAGLAASGARAAFVMLVVGLTVILMLRRGRSTVPVLLLASLGVWAAFSLTTHAVAERFSTVLDLSYSFQKWMGPLSVGLGIAMRVPFGMGLGYTAGIPSLLRDSQAFSKIETLNVDSGIGAAAAELGVAGLVIFLFLLVQLGICPLQNWRRMPDGTLKDLLLVPVTLALVFVMTAVITSLNASLPSSIYFWLLIGMTFKAPYLLPQRVRPEQAPVGAHDPLPHRVPLAGEPVG